jgi:hypothetical protein
VDYLWAFYLVMPVAFTLAQADDLDHQQILSQAPDLRLNMRAIIL